MRSRVLHAAVAALASLLTACGYHAVYAGAGAASERLHVALARGAVADAVAADEVASGVREELAREGALAGGEGYPRVEVEVTRLDEASDAIQAAGSPPARVPQARATEVGVVARAWLVRAENGEHERDTGDVRVLLDAAPAASASADAFQHEDAMHAAGRRAGIRLARRILGAPTPGEDIESDWQGRFR